MAQPTATFTSSPSPPLSFAFSSRSGLSGDASGRLRRRILCRPPSAVRMPLRLRAAPARAWLTCAVWAASMLLTTMFVWKVAALMLWPVVAVVWGLSIVTVLDMVYHRTLLKSERF
ncbi:hypothetical protein DAI22_10g144700 [Oryza sativa Japonica Group]|nr:hypothetical protein DAI22_10g144700 [Oryza sativa Japonica Group]